MVKFTNIKNEKDVVEWDSKSGTFYFKEKKRSGLRSYRGDDDSKMQIMWDDDGTMTPYWGW